MLVLGLLLFLLLVLLGWTNRPHVLVLLALLILAGVVLAYLFGGGRTLSRTVTGLEPGKAYYWRVIAEDGRGGTVESATWRFEIPTTS